MYSFYESVRSKKFGRTSTNMYLQYKWDTENFANHRYKVKTAKPNIDNSAPLTFTHMFIRPKKLQFELERYSTIQRNNRLLLERLATIQREGAWIDNKNYRQSRSLNTWKRQQEMIHLAHNNRIMIARLQDVKARHNTTKLEDEYLINQKYKATIQKWPPNWREIQQHLNHVKADIFKKVFDSKYQKEAYLKSRKSALQKWTLEKERLKALKTEKIAQEAIEAEKQKQIAKKEQKIASEKWLKSSAKLKSAEDKRLKKIEEEKKKQKFQEKEAKQKQKQKQKEEMKEREKYNENKKLKIEKWRMEKSEKDKEEKEKLEQEKKEADEKFKIMLKRKKLREQHKKQALTKDNRKKEFEEGKESIVPDVKTTGLEEEISASGSTHKKSITDESLLIQQLVSDIVEQSIISHKSSTKEPSDYDKEIPVRKQTSYGFEMSNGEKSTDEQANTDDESFTTEESISNYESSTEQQSGSDEGTLATEEATSSQDLLTEDVPNDKISTPEEPSLDNEEANSDETSSTTEQSSSD